MIKCYMLIVLLIVLMNIYALDYTIPPNTYSIESGDFDNDGDNDIVVSHNFEHGILTFIENINNSEFVIADTMHSFGAIKVYEPCNLDNEGGLDIITNYQEGFEAPKQMLVIYNYNYDEPYLYNTQDYIPYGNFTAGDFDADGDKDLAFSSYGAGQDNLWGIMYNLGNREFSEPQWYECPSQESNAGFYQIECKDLDNNGYDDIIAYTVMETYIYYDGNPTDPDLLNCYAPNGGMLSEDFDNDSDFDIIVSHWPGGSQSHFLIYENLGNRDFTLHDTTFNTLWGQPKATDVNCDNLIDIVNIGNVIGIGTLSNNGNLLFNEATYQMIESYDENYYRSAFADFDGNGSQDVAIIRNGISENNLTILYNDGFGQFLDEPQVVFNEECIVNNEKCKISNYPNPFNPDTTISYSLPDNVANPVIEIFNVKGQRICELKINNSEFKIGEASWDGTDQYRKPVSSGVYLYRVKADEFVSKSRKMILLK